MKKITVALITFSLGLFVFFLLNSQPIPVSEPEPIQYETPLVIPDNPLKTEVKIAEPFFKSFSKDEGYYGWLIPNDFKGMKEVWTISLSRDSENSKSDKLIWKAMILRNDIDYNAIDDSDYDFSSIWIKTENNKLSFKTKKYRNVEYKFNGEFIKNGKDFAQEEKVLKGTMQKFVKGKKVAEFTSDFAYFEPQCFH